MNVTFLRSGHDVADSSTPHHSQHIPFGAQKCILDLMSCAQILLPPRYAQSTRCVCLWVYAKRKLHDLQSLSDRREREAFAQGKFNKVECFCSKLGFSLSPSRLATGKVGEQRFAIFFTKFIDFYGILKVGEVFEDINRLLRGLAGADQCKAWFSVDSKVGYQWRLF